MSVMNLKRDIFQSNIYRILRKVNQVICDHVHKQYTWYHDPSSGSSPGILLTRLLYYTRCQSQKRDLIQSNIYNNLSKVTQVIYTLNTICKQIIIVLVQAILQIFCWQGSICIQCISRKRVFIQPNIYRILPKVNQTICPLGIFCVPDSMILVQGVLQILCWQCSIRLQCISRKRGINQSNVHRIIRQVNQVICIMYLNSTPDIMILP